MAHQFVRLLTLAAAAVLFLGGCTEKEKDPVAVGGYAPGSNIGAGPGGEPPKLDPTLVKTGQTLYEQNCAACHQADAIGKAGVAPSLTNPELLSVASDKFLAGTITKGRPGTGMPPFGHLEPEKITAIIAFLRSHATLPSRVAEVEALPEAHGDPRLGKNWYDQICSTCHGPNGDGYSAGGTGTAIGKVGFLSRASDGFIRVTIKEGRSNTRMRPFQGQGSLADLSDREIDDIIVYLRSLSQS